MLVLGILLLILVALVCLAAVVRGGDSVTVDLEFFSLRMDAVAVFIVGAATLLALLLGLWLVSSGLKRNRRRKQEVKALRKRAETSEEIARRERSAAAGGASAAPSSSTGSADGPDEHFDTAPRER